MEGVLERLVKMEGAMEENGGRAVKMEGTRG